MSFFKRHEPDQDIPASLSSAVMDRRRILRALSLLGIGTATFQRALADEAGKATEISVEQIANAEWIAGLSLTDEQRKSLQQELRDQRGHSEKIRSVPLQFDSLPAFRFDPEMATPEHQTQPLSQPAYLEPQDSTTGKSDGEPNELSFVSIRELGRRLRAKMLTSLQLTQHCLKQLVAQDPVLNCVVTLTEDLAMRQAEQADKELAEGLDRGPLHGIPWGAKDLIAVSGYPTTWGAAQFREQHLSKSATVAKQLEAAGAVLVAKLSLGALAMGDQWFGGQTKNPWNPEQGSSGSSAGSASAVAAGLVPFAIGSETLGSIISPTRRCGIAGLRPTFGRVSRAGCMALSWTMDKIGPIARSADDCGFVLSAIHGRDPEDPTTVDRWFQWPMDVDLSKVRIGRVTNSVTAPADQAAIDVLKELGATLVDIELPRDIPEWALASMLDVEAGCIFQELTRNSNLNGLNEWQNIFRASHFVSAIDFLQASRARFELMQKMAEVFKKVDVYIGGNDLGITNLTGHPSMAFPAVMTNVKPQTRPLCCTLTASLHNEATLLALAVKIENKADILKNRPVLPSV